ncbi:hypothetical protein BLNAU_4809 [Blattamonas nauphoetae]|uniref:Uncharacterized protein n=1 Tax=Blattamonas nauphoetae TaxID=2049346 RepID=A0ABQ9Y928_9EUKA|nr:hypothetical protein BLNAU_4809 [Blattamonas nauphoetae]
MDCSAFLNWGEDNHRSVDEKAVIVRSLVATLKFQPALDVSLEAKAVKLLESVDPEDKESADAFLCSFGRTIEKSSTKFIQSIVVLTSSPNRAITTATMKMLRRLIATCPDEVHLSLITADLIPQLIITLNPQSVPLSDCEDIHINLMKIVFGSLWLATPRGIRQLGIEDGNEQQAVHEIVMKQVLTPSEKYIWHLCVNRYSIVDGKLSETFLTLLPRLLRICPYYQPTMDFVLHMPVFLAIPSCLTFFEDEDSIWDFLSDMIDAQRERNETGETVQQMWRKMQRMLRMEGIDEMIEQKLQNDQKELSGRLIVDRSIRWNNQQGMNHLELW